MHRAHIGVNKDNCGWDDIRNIPFFVLTWFLLSWLMMGTIESWRYNNTLKSQVRSRPMDCGSSSSKGIALLFVIVHQLSYYLLVSSFKTCLLSSILCFLLLADIFTLSWCFVWDIWTSNGWWWWGICFSSNLQYSVIWLVCKCIFLSCIYFVFLICFFVDRTVSWRSHTLGMRFCMRQWCHQMLIHQFNTWMLWVKCLTRSVLIFIILNSGPSYFW